MAGGTTSPAVHLRSTRNAIVDTSSAARVVNTTRRLNQSQPAASGPWTVWLDHARPGVRRIIGSRGQELVLSTADPAREVAQPSVACGVEGCVVAWSQEGGGGTFDVVATIVR